MPGCGDAGARAWVRLGCAGAEKFLVRFEGSGAPSCRGIESEGDGLRVLIGRVECVAEIHEEGIALPTEAVFDVSVGEPSAVEEIRGRDADRVAGPSEEVPVSGGYVEDFVCDVPQEGCELGSGDLSSFTGGRVEIYCRGAVVGSAELFCAPDNVEAGLCGAHPV